MDNYLLLKSLHVLGVVIFLGNMHAATTGHPIIASFEPGEDWFYDYEKRGMIKGVELLPPHSHPEDQPSPGPAGRVPTNWESLLH
jgi:hypothetical protein